MTVKRIINVPLHVLCLLALTTWLAGCIKEDLDDCDDRYSLTVRAYAYETGHELGSEEVTDLSLFVFDNNLLFLYKIETTIGQKVPLTGPKDENLHIVAWGNLEQGNQTCIDPQPGDRMDDCFVELQTQNETRAEGDVLSPGDLFRGDIVLTASDRIGGDRVLPIYRTVGSLTVTIRNLQGSTGHADDDFHIVVRGTHSRIDFDGRSTGEETSYLPEGAFASGNRNDEYTVPAFRLLPEESGVNIEIYHGEELVTTVLLDANEAPIVIEKGRLTNVLINLSTSLGVSVKLTDWGNNYMWKEF